MLSNPPPVSTHSLICDDLDEYLRIPPSIGFLSLQKDLEQKYFFDKIRAFQDDFKSYSDNAENRVVAFLKEVWDDIKPNSLSYSCHPNSKSTKLMCKLATYAADSILNTEIVTANQNGHRLEIIIQLLMPGVIFECSDVSPYEGGSWDQVSIHQLLNSHILSSDQRYLIPINCLKNLVKIDADIAKLENIHAIIFGDTEHAFLDANELNRIKYHSAETQEVFSAYEALQTLANQDVSSLLGQINLLLKELYINSVQGYGSEFIAGSTAERAIRHFVHFYKQLTPPQKESLPAKVTEQIKYLHNCIADYSLGRLKSINAYTICMATRRQKLKEAIQGHESVLSRCGLSNINDMAVCDMAIVRLSNAVSSLESLIQCSGEDIEAFDKLPIDLCLVKKFDLSVSNLSIEHLTIILQCLSKQEIHLFFQHPSYQEQLKGLLFQSVSKYVFLASQLSMKQFEALFLYTPNQFISNNLVDLFSTLDVKKNKLIFNALVASNLSAFIGNRGFLLLGHNRNAPFFSSNISSDTIDLFWQALEMQQDICDQFFAQAFEYDEMIRMFSHSKVGRASWLYTNFKEKLEFHFMTLDLNKLMDGFNRISSVEIRQAFLSLIEPHCFDRILADESKDVYGLFFVFCWLCDFNSLQSLVWKLTKEKPKNIDLDPWKHDTRFQQFFSMEPLSNTHLYHVLSKPDEKMGYLINQLGSEAHYLVFNILLIMNHDRAFSLLDKDIFVDFIQYLCAKSKVLIAVLLLLIETMKLNRSHEEFIFFSQLESQLFDYLTPKLPCLIQDMSFDVFFEFYNSLTDFRKKWIFDNFQHPFFRIINDGVKLKKIISILGQEEGKKIVKQLESMIVNDELPDNICFDLNSFVQYHADCFSKDWRFYFKLLQSNPESFLYIPDDIRNNRRFVFCAYVYAGSVISYLPHEYEKDSELDLELCIVLIEDFFESAKYFNNDFLLKKAFTILLPHLDLLIKKPNDINEFFQRCSDHQCQILSSINGFREFFIEQLSLCSMEFLCNSLDKDNFPYFLRTATFLNDAVIQKLVNYQQAGVILNKLFAESSRGFSSLSIYEQASDLLVLFWVKLYKSANLPRMSGESMQIMKNELEGFTIHEQFREAIEMRHDVLLDINSDMLSILRMMRSYGLDENFILSAIKQNALAFEEIPERYKSDLNFVMQAIECNPRIGQFLSESIKEQLPMKTKMLLLQSSAADRLSSFFSRASTKANPDSVISSEAERSP